MSMSDAKKRANAKWDKENTRRVSVVLRNGSTTSYEAVKTAADNANLPMNKYIVTAIEEKMSREREG